MCACSQYTERLGEYKTVHQLPVSTRKESPGSGINLQSFYNEITITGNYLGNISAVRFFELQNKDKEEKVGSFSSNPILPTPHYLSVDYQPYLF